MKILYFLVFTVATSVLVSPSAYSAPSHGMQVTHVNSFYEDATGCNSDYYFYACFHAEAYDDFYSGQPQGMVEVWGYDFNTSYSYDIWCSGPAYVNVVSVDKNNGDSSINATLDPSSGDCFNYNVSAPVTLNVTGKYNGNYRDSANGTGKTTSGEVSYKYNSQSDSFDETFTGTNGFYTGAFSGNAGSDHFINRQKVK